jgi:tetratricopeptide (TPR) repeat protein
MREGDYTGESQYSWIVYGVALLLIGGLGGYVLTTIGRGAQGAPAPVLAGTAGVSLPAEEASLRAYRDILARDPANLQAATDAANLLYDARRYAEAVPFYQKAFALAPTDINISTDLGTALWYSGRTDEALAQYDRSLAINPTHAQTLFNLGIVQRDGRHDKAAAAAVWEKLLDANPGYPNAAEVRQLIADARRP